MEAYGKEEEEKAYRDDEGNEKENGCSEEKTYGEDAVMDKVRENVSPPRPKETSREDEEFRRFIVNELSELRRKLNEVIERLNNVK